MQATVANRASRATVIKQGWFGPGLEGSCGSVIMGQPLIAANRVAVEWWATFIDPDQGQITLPGCLLLRFAPDNRCQDLWEYWQVQPGKQAPPNGWGAA